MIEYDKEEKPTSSRGTPIKGEPLPHQPVRSPVASKYLDKESDDFDKIISKEEKPKEAPRKALVFIIDEVEPQTLKEGNLQDRNTNVKAIMVGESFEEEKEEKEIKAENNDNSEQESDMEVWDEIPRVEINKDSFMEELTNLGRDLWDYCYDDDYLIQRVDPEIKMDIQPPLDTKPLKPTQQIKVENKSMSIEELKMIEEKIEEEEPEKEIQMHKEIPMEKEIQMDKEIKIKEEPQIKHEMGDEDDLYIYDENLLDYHRNFMSINDEDVQIVGETKTKFSSEDDTRGTIIEGVEDLDKINKGQDGSHNILKNYKLMLGPEQKKREELWDKKKDSFICATGVPKTNYNELICEELGKLLKYYTNEKDRGRM